MWRMLRHFHTNEPVREYLTSDQTVKDDFVKAFLEGRLYNTSKFVVEYYELVEAKTITEDGLVDTWRASNVSSL